MTTQPDPSHNLHHHLPPKRSPVLYWKATIGFLFLVTSCSQVVENGLDEEQANELIVTLQSQGIGASKEMEKNSTDGSSFRVSVASQDMGQALTVLRNEGLPKTQKHGIEELFSRKTLVPSSTEEKARLVTAVSGEITQTLESIDGIRSARVHLSLPMLPSQFGLHEKTHTSKASVLIRYEPEQPLSLKAEDVQALVAGAIEGLEKKNVTVVTIPVPDYIKKDQPTFVAIGPFSVSNSSVGIFKAFIITSALLNLILLIAFVLFVRKHRRLAEKPSET